MSSPLRKTLAFSVIFMVIASFHIPVLDKPAAAFNQEALQRAFVTFGIARGLNGVISVVQETEISAQPAGVGVVFSPGQVLDPVNDLIERFSWVMLLSTSSLGVQQLLLQVASSPTLNWAFTFIVALLAIFVLFNRDDTVFSFKRSLVQRLILAIVFLRFVTPVFTVGQHYFFEAFLKPSYEQASLELKATEKELEGNAEVPQDIKDIQQGKSRSLIQRFRSAYADAKKGLGIDGQLTAIKSQVSAIFERIIRLISLFLLETVLMPLLFFWMMSQMWRYLIQTE